MLVLAFAGWAAKVGWTEAALTAFCDNQGLSDAERRRLWPNGVRSVGWQFNDIADRQTHARFAGVHAPTLAEIVMARFVDNAPHKQAVSRLAASDLRHPLDTLLRTGRTAELIWTCYAAGRPATRRGGSVDRWLLVVAYSFCVIVWLFDRAESLRATRRAVRMSLAMMEAGSPA